MITKEVLKAEIDKVQDGYLDILYDVIKAFERQPSLQPDEDAWNTFLEKFAGCFTETPIERGIQGTYEQREPLL